MLLFEFLVLFVVSRFAVRGLLPYYYARKRSQAAVISPLVRSFPIPDALPSQCASVVLSSSVCFPYYCLSSSCFLPQEFAASHLQVKPCKVDRRRHALCVLALLRLASFFFNRKDRREHKENEIADECTALLLPYYYVPESSQEAVIFTLLFPCRSVYSVVQSASSFVLRPLVAAPLLQVFRGSIFFPLRASLRLLRLCVTLFSLPNSLVAAVRYQVSLWPCGSTMLQEG